MFLQALVQRKGLKTSSKHRCDFYMNFHSLVERRFLIPTAVLIRLYPWLSIFFSCVQYLKCLDFGFPEI